MSNISLVPEQIIVSRGDPVYMAHAYLTKVPVPAIAPFVEAFCPPGGVVVDPFAGSGMTGVAAACTDRKARLSDVSVLGQHIGSNYVNFVDPSSCHRAASRVVAAARSAVGDIYGIPGPDGERWELAKTVWSALVACADCGQPVNYYRALEAAGWSKQQMFCLACGAPVSSRNRRVGEVPVVDCLKHPDSRVQYEQAATSSPDGAGGNTEGFPHVEITPDRQMYKASALGKSGLTTVASFYSPRNGQALVALSQAILSQPDAALRRKLLFAFTATLTRASKRYQWSHKRPLNAANANYYVAPVFYEWNVFDLFERKVMAVLRSDEWVSRERGTRVPPGTPASVDVTYEIASADALPYCDNSIDYVFTDPPFGSNLFYSDMALFHEGWLDGFTDVTKEAVIDRGSDTRRSSDRYETLLTDALKECRRVLKPGGRVSMVFGNSSGAVWALVQRAVERAGLTIEPDHIAILNKGQRSVKGLASGFEYVATLDLILTMKERGDGSGRSLHQPSEHEVVGATMQLAEDNQSTPSHLYLELLRLALRENWSVAGLNLKTVTQTLTNAGWKVDDRSGRLVRASPTPR